MLAAEAWRKDLLSEGQLARLLHIDRVAVRELLDALAEDPADADEHRTPCLMTFNWSSLTPAL